MPNALARKYRVDVSTDLTMSSGFIQLNGVDDFNDKITPNLEDSSAYDTSGWTTREVTMQDAELTISAFRKFGSGLLYDPVQSLVRATRGQFGDQARLAFRWYDKQGGPEAYQSVFIPSWERNNTGVANLEKVSITGSLSDVPVQSIANPIAGATVPVIVKASPSAAPAGNTVALTGGNFTGTTAVTVGGTAVGTGKFTVLSDGALAFVVPAGSAGSAPIIVTNAAGASAAFAYTRA